MSNNLDVFLVRFETNNKVHEKGLFATSKNQAEEKCKSEYSAIKITKVRRLVSLYEFKDIL